MRLYHGEANKTIEYHIWKGIKSRCYNKNNISYKWYGAKGIKICDRWLNSYPNFLEDMGRRPKNKTSIDRIDSNKNYEHSNCRWANKIEQSRNKSNNHRIFFKNKNLTISEWAELTGINRGVIHTRIRLRWDVKDILSNKSYKNNPVYLSYNGETNHIRGWSRKLNIPKSTIIHRIKTGLPVNEILHNKNI